MANCERMTTCPMPLEEGVGLIYQKHYCTSDFTSCARFRVLKNCGGAAVPRWLKPNMNDEGTRIITEFNRPAPLDGIPQNTGTALVDGRII